MQQLGEYHAVSDTATAMGIRYKTLLKRIARGKVKYETFGRLILIHSKEHDRLVEEERKRANP